MIHTGACVHLVERDLLIGAICGDCRSMLGKLGLIAVSAGLEAVTFDFPLGKSRSR